MLKVLGLLSSAVSVLLGLAFIFFPEWRQNTVLFTIFLCNTLVLCLSVQRFAAKHHLPK